MKRIIGLFFILTMAGTALVASPNPVAADTENVSVGTYWFCNSSYQSGVCPTSIAVGDTVVWNFTAPTHTTTECGGDNNCNNANPTPLWDSGVVSSGGTFQYTFTEAGTYSYQCNVHGALMRGTVTVTGGVGGVAELVAPEADALSEEAGGRTAVISIVVGALAATIAGAAGVVLLRQQARMR
jgi:plastocyanin